MKKLIAVFTCLALILSFTSCQEEQKLKSASLKDLMKGITRNEQVTTFLYF